MSAAGDVRDSQELFVLTFKGQVTVHYVDGHTLEGELSTQDVWNIFLIVDQAPVMIPRSQILYIKGATDQPIERDTSQQTYLAPEAEQISAPEQAEQADEEDLPEATFVMGPDTLESLSPELLQSDPDDADRTGVRLEQPASEEADEDDMTFVLPSTADLSAEIEKLSQPEIEDDATIVFDEAEDEDEITYVFEDEEDQPGVIARLVCTSGPHAGDEFDLRGEVVTIGRSQDNEVPLSLDKEISRRHAILKLESGQYVIQDQNSLNGTYINDERIDGPRVLQDGDTILVGITDIRVEIK
jgi:hypothetical protein